MFTSLKRLGVISGLSATLLLAACGGSGDSADNDGEGTTNDTDAAYGEEMNYSITGIEPGAGVFKAAEAAVEEYGLDGWEVQASSSGAMATALGEAYENEEPIIVTGWSPHWKFAKYDLKYLEDPKGVFGEAETINTAVREGLEDDMPEAYEVLDNFNWTPDDLEAIMLEISTDVSPEDAATAWIEENEDKVSEWGDGVDEVDGGELEQIGRAHV